MKKGHTEDLNELLSAYLDGELDEATRAKVVSHLSANPAVAQLLNELRETRNLLRGLPRPPVPEGFAEDVMAAAERQALIGEQGAQPAKPARFYRWGPWRAAAGHSRPGTESVCTGCRAPPR